MRLTSLLLLVTGLFAAGCAAKSHEIIVNMPSTDRDEGIFVSGNGEARGAPDLATVVLGVRSRAPDAQQAMQQVSQQMATILASVKALGIAESDIRTENASMYEERIDPPAPPQPVRGKKDEVAPPALPAVFYVANSTISINVRKLDQVGTVVTAATQSGANEVQNISFSLQDPSSLHLQARDKALADARRQAEVLAKAANMSLGQVVSIQTNASGGGFAMGRGAAMEASPMAKLPVAPGELVVQEEVRVRFELVKPAN